MSKKSRNKQSYKSNKNNFPYSSEVEKMKEEFKKMIDEMSDEEFLDFSFSLMNFSDNFEDMWAEDEGWEDEVEIFYNNEKNINNFTTTEDDSLPF